MTDPFNERGYNAELHRHQQAARRALILTREIADALLHQIDTKQQVPFTPRDLTTAAADAYARLTATDALQQVSFLLDHQEETRQ
jgi:hypothetical protein